MRWQRDHISTPGGVSGDTGEESVEALVLKFFEELLMAVFVETARDKISGALKRRNVELTVARSAMAPSQVMDTYFRSESIDASHVEWILEDARAAIEEAAVDAGTLASASLSAEKLTEDILAKSPVPERLIEAGLEWPFQMALRISADALCNIGPRFADWERAAWRRSFDAFDKMVQNQEEILRVLGPGGQGTADERFAHTYRSHVLRRLAQVDAATFRVSSSLFLDLSAVFVQPDVSEVLTLEEGTGPDDYGASNAATLEQARMEVLSGKEREKAIRVPAQEFVVAKPRCIISGLPGSGKTTLLQHILLAAARDEEALGLPPGTLPFLVKARHLGIGGLPGARDLMEVAEGRVVAGANPGFLERRLESGQAMLMIDGLDEVVPEQRDHIASWVSDFVDCYPKARYVMSSRPGGYSPDSFRKLGFSEATLCPFSTEQIREYVSRWSAAVEIADGATPAEAEQAGAGHATALVRSAESNPYVHRIATNPLLLSTLCLVQRYEGGDLPNRRVVLYQRCVEGLLFHWDNKRGLPPEILGAISVEKKLQLLRRLALGMQVRGVAECDEGEVLDSFSSTLSEYGGTATAAALLGNIRDRSGLLIERRPRAYGFSHLTFQEYLAALGVLEGDLPEYDRLFLFSRRGDPQWHEVISLYCGVAPRGYVENLLDELMDTDEPSSTMLAGACLAAAKSIGAETRARVLQAILSLPEPLSSSDDWERYGPNRVSSALRQLEASEVFEQAEAALANLDRVHALNFFYSQNSAEGIALLREVGLRVIRGEQATGQYAYGLTYILLSSDRPQAIAVLDEFADALVDEDTYGREGTSILGGIVATWGWGRFLDIGVLQFLNSPSDGAECLGVLRFLDVATSAKVLRPMLPFYAASIWPDPPEYQRALHSVLGSMDALTHSDDSELSKLALRVGKQLRDMNRRIQEAAKRGRPGKKES